MFYRWDVGKSVWRARKNGGANSYALLSEKRYIIYTISRARNVNWDTYIGCREIVCALSERKGILRYTSRYKSRALSRSSLSVYQGCHRRTLCMVFSWRLNYPNAVPKNDLIAAEESRRTLRSSIQATGKSERENRSRWEFNISLIEYLLSPIWQRQLRNSKMKMHAVCCSLGPAPWRTALINIQSERNNLTRETKRHFLSSRSRNDGMYTFCFISRIPALCARIHILTRLVLSRSRNREFHFPDAAAGASSGFGCAH